MSVPPSAAASSNTATPGAINTLPPITHAIGGSLGSALALLLLYPLERARIEMQAVAARSPKTLQREEPFLVHRKKKLQKIRGGGAAVATRRARKKPTFVFDHENVKDKSDIAEKGYPSPSEEDSSWATEGIESSNHAQQPDEPAAAAAATELQQVEDDDDDDDDEELQLSLVDCFRRLWVRNELYRGVGPIVTTLATSNFIFFYVNALMKHFILKAALKKTPTISSTSYWALFASGLAGMINVIVTNPMWVANLRIITGDAKSSNVLAEIRNVAKEQGVAHLWSGTYTSIMLVSNPVIQFFTYDAIKTVILASGRSTSGGVNLAPLEAFLTGALAKAVATILTYPLQLCQSVLRLQRRTCTTDTTTSSSSSEDNDAASSTEEPKTTAGGAGAGDRKHQHHYEAKYRGTRDCLVKLYRRDGIKGLYTGIRAKMLQTVCTAALTFLTYEQILKAVYAVQVALLKNKRAI